MNRLTHLHIVDGATHGPDGEPLDRFASFAERIMRGGSLDDDYPYEPPPLTLWQRFCLWLGGLHG